MIDCSSIANNVEQFMPENISIENCTYIVKIQIGRFHFFSTFIHNFVPRMYLINQLK